MKRRQGGHLPGLAALERAAAGGVEVLAAAELVAPWNREDGVAWVLNRWFKS